MRGTGHGARRARTGRRGRAVLRAASTLVLSLALLLPAAQALANPELRLVQRAPVAPGLVREVYRFDYPRGPVVVQALRFRPDDPRVTLRPELSRGSVPGKEPTHLAVRRLGEAAVAGVNASFPWDSVLSGDPLGLFVRNGQYLSEPQRRLGRWSGAFALLPDGSYRIGVPDFNGWVSLPDGTTVPLSGVNRPPAQPRPDRLGSLEVTLFSPAYGSRTGTPAGTVEVALHGVSARPNTNEIGGVGGLRTSGSSTIPAGGVVLSGTGERGDLLRRLRPGDHVEVHLRSDPAWDDVLHAVGAGPVIVRDGRPTPPDSWASEGFGPRHNGTTHPRTIVGFLESGEMVLVAVDGRRSWYSNGLRTGEAAHLMVQMGARDAVMVDGGGSTTMVVDGLIQNRPCCDSRGYRSVASHLVIRSNVPTPDVVRTPGWDRYTLAANIAKTGWPDGSPTAVLVNGELFPDALAAGPLAASRSAPLLLTTRDRLHWRTAAALRDLGTKRVLVVGGPGVVSEDVAGELREAGYSVKRIAGDTRTETAAVVAWYVSGASAGSGRVFLASATSWPDALAAGAVAGQASMPVLTTAPGRLSEPAAAMLERLAPQEVVIIGGEGAIRPGVAQDVAALGIPVTRVGGATRFATAVAIAEWGVENLGSDASAIGLASGFDFPDALVAAPLAARRRAPLLLAHGADVDQVPEVRSWLDRYDIDEALLFGSRGDLSTWVAHQLQEEVDTTRGATAEQ
ncbi:MAG: cell wall-binding repeat-containing protein [Nitriliruptorales bacterium]